MKFGSTATPAGLLAPVMKPLLTFKPFTKLARPIELPMGGPLSVPALVQ